MSTHVKINGQTYLYQQKAPFVASGESVKGALEYNPSTDKIRCHECGRWFGHVGSHAAQAHGLLSEDYKTKHGLKQSTALIAEGPRSALVLSGHRVAREHILKIGAQTRIVTQTSLGLERRRLTRYEQRNERSTCHEQLLAKLRELADRLGRTPTIHEAREAGISPSSTKLAFNCKWPKVMELVGLMPRHSGHRTDRIHYTDGALLQMLSQFIATHGRKPQPSDQRRGLLPDSQTYYRHFGSMRAAYQRLAAQDRLSAAG